MKSQDIKRIVRKTGLPISNASMSSRVRGWSSYCSEGVDFGSVYPWKTVYVRNGYRVPSILSDRTQNMRISYTGGYSMSRGGKDGWQERGAEALKKIKEALTAAGVSYSEKDGELSVEVDNPYSEHEVKRAEERWNWVVSQRR